MSKRFPKPEITLDGIYSKFADESFCKDFLLYIVAVGLGAGIAGLFHVSFFLFPLIATFIALIVFVVKSLVIDSVSPIEALKADALPIVGFVIGIILTIVLYNRR